MLKYAVLRMVVAMVTSLGNFPGIGSAYYARYGHATEGSYRAVRPELVAALMHRTQIRRDKPFFDAATIAV
jgi:hypothetical protein